MSVSAPAFAIVPHAGYSSLRLQSAPLMQAAGPWCRMQHAAPDGISLFCVYPEQGGRDGIACQAGWRRKSDVPRGAAPRNVATHLQLSGGSR